jgi:cation:H+ antiporter
MEAAARARRAERHMTAYLMVAAGLVALFLGGDWLVRGAVAIAKRLGLAPLLIGLTVVGFGTSTPELLVSVDAALRGVPDIAIGNVVGSNIANVLLILGLTAVIWPITVSGATLRRDCAVMVAAAVALVPLFALGEMGRLAGLALVTGLGLFLAWAYMHPSDADVPEEVAVEGPPQPLWKPVGWVVLGLVALMLGARWLVDGSVTIARGFGISEAFIGLTIVAVGTSLPELATSLIAAFRRHSEIALGNVVGSNIFNILGILGITAVITPIPVAGRFLTFDLPVMIGVSLVLAALLLLRPSIGRAMGAALLAAYVAYVWAAR